MSSYLSKSENSALASSIKYKNAEGSALIGYNSGFNYHPYTDTFYYYPFEEIYNSTYLFKAYTLEQTLIDADTLYYVAFSYYPDKKNFQQIILYSTSEIYLKDYGSYISYSSDSDLYYSVYKTSIDTNSYSYFVPYGVSFASGTVLNCLDFKTKPPIQYSNTSSDLKSFSFRNDNESSTKQLSMMSVYCNFNLDTSLLPNVTPQKFDKLSVNGQEAPLSDFIDVKLTPEFGLDMDRVFDKNTGQNDYFKLEVINNSDTNIQFYCAIVDPGVKTLYNDNGQVSDFAFNHSYWNYIHDSEYYQLASKTESRYIGFASTTTFYANKLAGNIFWIILKPDEHFEDYIYWENVKIMPSTSYDFLCEACPTENDIATDMFVTSNEQLEKQFYLSGGSKAHFWSISESVEVDQSVEQYALQSEDVCEIYRVNFSVLSIPEFSATVRGGNSKITSGWSDTQKQASNPYYKQNLMTGQIEGIENYKEFKGNLSDVDVNLDDVGIDDVKSYISYSQSFFGLLKSVFQCFPALWIIIVFGLTAIVVIAIVRYIRG